MRRFLPIVLLAAAACANAAGSEAGDPPAGGSAPPSATDPNRPDLGADGGGVFDAGGGPGRDGGGTTPAPDASAQDGASGGADAGARDGSSSGSDAGDGGPVLGDGGAMTAHVHIYIDNFCNVSISPQSITVPPGGVLYASYHNHSVDYEADVWMSYGGGYLALARGGVWNEPVGMCSGPSAYTAYADISIAGGPTSACPKQRLLIYCQ